MNAEISETITARKSGLGMLILNLLNSAILFQKGATTTLMPTKAYKAKTRLLELQKTSLFRCFNRQTSMKHRKTSMFLYFYPLGHLFFYIL